MQRTTCWAILVPLLLVGCTDDGARSPSESGDPEVPAPAAVFYGEALCSNVLLFQLVDYADTDPYLPPGFHPRDSQGFLGTAVAFGQGAVLFMTLRCQSAASGPLDVAFLGIFVEAPEVPGISPAPFNFYELARYGQAGEFGGALQAIAWPWEQANVTIGNIAAGGRTFDVDATVSDAEGEIAYVGGVLAGPVPVGNGPTRFWHQDGSGLAFIEYGAFLDSQVGPGTCSARAGTALAAFVGRPAVGPYNCTGVADGGDPLVAVLAGLQLNATFQHLPGASAK
ncbi:MAG: hypothetical protein ACYC2H_11610 [Thermoplasmatota archaeon]